MNIQAKPGHKVKYSTRRACRAYGRQGAEEFSLRDVLKQAKYVFEGVKDAQDALDYIEQLLNRR